MSEDKLQRAIERAAKAQRLFDDKTLNEAFDGLDEDLVGAIRNSTNKDDCWDCRLQLHALTILRSKLQAFIDNGKLALAEVERTAKK
jgi:hypothetical protein